MACLVSSAVAGGARRNRDPFEIEAREEGLGIYAGNAHVQDMWGPVGHVTMDSETLDTVL